MKSATNNAQEVKAVKLKLPKQLYRRVSQAAQAAQCEVSEIIVATLENRVPVLPDSLPPELAADLWRWTVLNDEALRAIAEAFLPLQQQRRYTTLLRRAATGKLTARQHAEWEALQQEYLRVSQNKAKARFLLAQREKEAASLGVAA